MKLSDVITREQHRRIVFGYVDLLDDVDLYQSLFDYLLPEMPYGVAKARTGDPEEWIFDRLCEEW